MRKAATKLRILGCMDGASMMWRLIKFLFILAVLAAIAFIGYAYLGPIFMPTEFAPQIEEVVKPVTLGGDS